MSDRGSDVKCKYDKATVEIHSFYKRKKYYYYSHISSGTDTIIYFFFNPRDEYAWPMNHGMGTREYKPAYIYLNMYVPSAIQAKKNETPGSENKAKREKEKGKENRRYNQLHH